MKPGSSPFTTDAIAARYRVDSSRIPAPMAERFVALEPDSGTERFLAQAERRRAGPVATRLHGWLGRFLSDFDVNGLLDMYPLHLLSTDQFRRLLRADTDPRPANGDRSGVVLDVGAGSGDVTRTLAPLFDRVVAFETSRAMRRRLRQRGFVAHGHDLVATPTTLGPFDAITCLNVLDRCARPRRLLEHALAALAPDGLLVVALALPYAPFYYRAGRTLDPEEPLRVEHSDWEGALSDLVRRELEPIGLTVVAWTRAPYLSAGDTRRPLYVLDDAIVVLRRR